MESYASLKKGTTTVGIKTIEGVVLAADKRATAGFMVANKKINKIAKISDYCAVTIAGTVAQAFYLVETLRVRTQLYFVEHNSKLSVRGIANLASNILQSQKFALLPVALLIGGYDSEARLYMLDFFGSISEEKFIATGSGYSVAMGVIHSNYKEGMDIISAASIAAKAIRAAIEWDAPTGEGIDLALIDKSGVRLLTKNEIEKLVSKAVSV